MMWLRYHLDLTINMGRIFEVKQTQFNGGISEDKRDGWSLFGNTFYTNKFSITKHFDVFTYPKKLVPFERSLAFPGENKALDIVKFVYAPRNAGQTTFRLFGFGVVSGTTAKVYMNDASDTADDAWGTPSNGQSGNASRNEDIFFHYKLYLYMYSGGNSLDRFDVTSSGAFGDGYQTISYTTTERQSIPVHHPADDVAYFFADNVVHKLDNTTWTGSTLTLPSNMNIVAATPFGDFLAIGCVTKGTFNRRSWVFLWDRDSSLTTVTAKYDFGDGVLRHLVNLDNKLIGILEQNTDVTNANNRGRVLIKQASGTSSVTLNELTLDDNNSANDAMPNTRVVRDNKIYFPARIPLDSDARLGIWVVDSNGNASLAYVEEDLSDNGTGMQGIYLIANQWWIAHSNDGSTERTANADDSNDNPTYSTTNASLLETLIFNADDPSRNKKLVGVTVFTEPMPTAGQIVLKYRKDTETSWTTIFTNTTDSDISHSAVNIESDGSNLPQFKEIQFRIESTGGAVITGFKARVEELDDDMY
jgi:hypothetical protein